jgi:predicted transglutaminase-like cysteine proteinase
MARGRRVFAAVCAVASCFVTSHAGAAQPVSKAPEPWAAFAPVAAALDRSPLAWPDYCVRHGDDCGIDLREPLTINLTPARLDEVTAVNLAINRIIRPMTDIDHWGVDDHWDLAEDGYGDCEDYQLLKRQLLVEAGFPRRAMLMTVVHDEDDNGHALLMIRTSAGDLVLDNRTDDILPWRQTGYRFIQRESQYASGWVDIEDLPDSTAVVAGGARNALSGTTAATRRSAGEGPGYDVAGPPDEDSVGGAD